MHNEELSNLYCAWYNLKGQVKEGEIGRACSTNGDEINAWAYKISLPKPEGKR
jgi:hypothetical protein